MPDDPISIGELARRLAAVHADIKEDIQEFGRRLDKKVNLDVFKVEQGAQDRAHQDLVAKVAALEQGRVQDRRDADNRRWQIYLAILAGVLSFLASVYLASQGG